MKTRNFILSFLMMMFCSVAFAQNAGQNSYDWGEFNYHNYPDSEQVLAVLKLDEEVVNGQNYEIAPFCGTELRGNAVKVTNLGNYGYLYVFSVHGELTETITFKLYDYETGTLFDNVSTTKVVLGDEEGPNGTYSAPIEIDFYNIAEVAGVRFGSLAKAIAAATPNDETVKLLTDVDTDNIVLPSNVSLDLNGNTAKADIIGEISINNGLWITSQGYKMIGVGADYYQTTDATIVMGENYSLEMVSGTVTLVPTVWYTLDGQNITINEGAVFNIEEGQTFIVNGSEVVNNGTVNNAGTVKIMGDATVKGNLIGNIAFEGGSLITADIDPTTGKNFQMVGKIGDSNYYYNTDNSTINIDAYGNVTIVSGYMTLGKSWRTLPGQTVTIASDATFNVPAGMVYEIRGTAIVYGAIEIEGDVKLADLNATAKAVAGLNITSAIENYYVIYREGTYRLCYAVAKINDVYYETLPEAVAAAQAGAIVEVIRAAEGAGVVINKNVTIDFGGFTYTINQAVGSKGTESQGFQLLKNAENVTLTNGNISVAEGTNVVWMINDYAKNLTVSGVTFDCANMVWSKSSCRLIVANNQHGTDPQAVFDEVAINFYGTEYPHALIENKTSLTAQAGLNVVTDPGFVVVYENGVYTVESAVAKIGSTYYRTLPEAVAAAQAGATVEVIRDAEGAGVVINKNVTIDFGGFTYTINQAVGSKGTESQGFQLLKNAENVTLTNGNISVAEGTNVVWMINDYAKNLTVSGVTFDCANMVWSKSSCRLIVANNQHGTDPQAVFDEVAINFYGTEYPHALIENKTSLTAQAGLNVVTDPGFVVVYENGVYTVESAVAKIGSTYYRTLPEAVAAAQAGATVEVIRDAEGAGVVINKNVTIDFGGFTYTINQAVGSKGTESQGFQLLKNAENVTLTNGNISVAEGTNVVWMINDYAKNLTVSGVTFDCANMVWSKSSCRLIVANNQHGTDPQAVFDEVAINFYGTEYPHALIENKTSLTAQAGLNVVTDPGFVVVYENGVYTVESAVAKIGSTYYRTLPEAVAAAQAGATVEVIRDAEGAGVVINKNVTIDFGGFTYTINQAVGSKGTESQGFQLLKNAENVTLTNGNISVAEGTNVVWMINDYAKNLTVSGVTFDCANMVWSKSSCRLIVANNQHGTDPQAVFDEVAINFYGTEYPHALIENKTSLTAQAGLNVVTDPGFVVVYENGVYTVESAVAKIGSTYYRTLPEAVAAAQAGATVEVIRDAEGAGVVINKNVTIDFGGKTYSFNEGVGSTGTPSNGFQIIEGNTVTLQNGALNVAEEAADKFYILVQNYANLNVVDMNLDGTNLDKWSKVATDQDSYVLSNNSGIVNISGATNITANNDGNKAFAFDVCKYANYEAPVVNVTTTGFINGAIEVTPAIANNLTITSGTYTADYTDYCADGYICSEVENGNYTVVKSNVAKIGTTEYLTLAEAVAAANDEDVIIILRDVRNGAGVVIDKDITIDFVGHKYAFKSGVGSKGTESNGFQIIEGNEVALQNGTLEVNATFSHNFYILVQNYADLTVEDMMLDGTNLDKWSKVETDQDSYVLSNNSGIVNIIGSTAITANEDGEKAFAFDVCKYGNYAVPTVNVNTTGIINGNVEVTAEINSNLNISGGYFTAEIQEAWCAEGYIPTTEVLEGVTYYTVKEGAYVARNMNTLQGYETLQAAVNEAEAGHTIALLQDITLDGGYADDEEAGLGIDLPGNDEQGKGLTIDGCGYTINCGNYTKGIRVYNHVTGKPSVMTFNNVTIVNDNAYGRCIDTRSGNINLKVNATHLIAENGNSQPLTIGGSEKIHRVSLGENTVIDAGESGYGIICFVSTNVDVITTGNTTINGYAAFYVKGDALDVQLDLGQGVYTGKNVHAGESNTFGTVVLEGNNTMVKVIGTNPTIYAVAEGSAAQAAFLVLGENNTISIESETANIEPQGENAYWAMIDAEVAESTVIRYGAEDNYTRVYPAAQARGFQFMSLEEAVRYANEEDNNVLVVNNSTGAGVVINKDVTIDFNKKTYSFNEGVGDVPSNGFQILAGNNVTLKNGTLNVAEEAAEKFYILVQNYANLNVVDMNLDGTNLDKWSRVETDQDSYVLSNNCGTIIISGETNITANDEGDLAFAFDVCKYTSYNAPSVKVETTGIIEGKVEVTTSANASGEGTPDLKIYSGYFSEEIQEAWCPEGYIPTTVELNGVTYYTVKIGTFVARNMNTDRGYETLRAAVDAAEAGHTIKLLADITLEGGYADATEGLRIEKAITLDGDNHTINCGDFKNGIRLYNPENISEEYRQTINNVTIINEVTDGRCVDTRQGNIILRIHNSSLIAQNGNTQPLTIGGYEPIKAVTLNAITIDAGNDGYAVINFVAPKQFITTAGRTSITGFAAFYVKADGTLINIGQGTHTGASNHSGSSNDFATIVLESDNNTINVDGSNAFVYAKAEGESAQAAFIINGDNNKIDIKPANGNGGVVLEGENAYWALINGNVTGTEIIVKGETLLPAAEIPGFGFYGVDGEVPCQFMSLEEAIRYAGKNGIDEVKVINDNTVEKGIVISNDFTIDLNGKAVIAAEDIYPVIRIQDDANVTVTDLSEGANGSITNATDYVFVLGSANQESAGYLTIENGTFTGMTTVASVTKGVLAINGGEFIASEGEYGAQYLINCVDANYKDGSAKVVIKGGKYHEFNPENNAAEGANTNFCASGYSAVETETGSNIWIVVAAQAYTLAEGWNWFSSYIVADDLLENVQGQIGASGIQIKAQNDMFNNYDTVYNWYGTLDAISLKEMYMIKVNEDKDLFITGAIANPADYEITINKNWSWIGYPMTEAMSVTDALAGLTPNDGDIIKGHDGSFTFYINGFGWVEGGNNILNTLVPGNGYMYYSYADANKAFNYSYPTTNRSAAKANETAENNYWKANASAFANNMTMIAVLNVNGIEMNDGVEVAAFVNGEVRGSARPVYVEAIDSYMLFLSVYGNDQEEVTFKYIDLYSEEVYTLDNMVVYSDNAIFGSVNKPMVLNYGTMGIGENGANTISLYPNPTTTNAAINFETVCDMVEVFNSLGVRVAEYRNVDSIDGLEAAGVYVIRVTNGETVQNCRLIVK